MKRKTGLTKLLASFLGCLVLVLGGMVTGASALPTLDLCYNWVNAPYWTITDLTTALDGTSLYLLSVENASNESNFGLFTVDNINSPSTVTHTLQVFAASDEPSLDPPSERTVYFQNVSNVWQASLDHTNWIDFDINFGFYFDVFDVTDTSQSQTYYSDPTFNPVDEGFKILTSFDGTSKAVIYLDSDSDLDYDDMTVHASDVAPVPEPATIMLMGAGLLGIGSFARRRYSEKS